MVTCKKGAPEQKNRQILLRIILIKLTLCMAKTICDFSKKDLEKEPQLLFELTRDPQFYCQKCGRVANTKKVLCKAKDFGKIK